MLNSITNYIYSYFYNQENNSYSHGKSKLKCRSVRQLNDKDIINPKLNEEIVRAIETETTHPEVSFLGKGISAFHAVKLASVPKKIFKFCDNSEQLDTRVIVNNKAQEIINTNGFTRLILPQFQTIKSEDNGVIIENELQIMPGDIKQNYANNEKNLKQAVIEMAEFICLTSAYGIIPKNFPLVLNPETNELGFALVGLEHSYNKPPLDGILGFERQYRPQAEHGLARHFPRYANEIVQITHKHLLANNTKDFPYNLSEIVARANNIISREQNIEAFYLKQGITKNSLAIPQEFIDTILLEAQKFAYAQENRNDGYICKIPTNETIVEIINDINAVICKQTKLWNNLAHARQWRLTPDLYNKDSNFKRNIYNNRFFIEDFLLPCLQKYNIIHSVLNYEEACNLDIHVLNKHLNNNNSLDFIVQF